MTAKPAEHDNSRHRMAALEIAKQYNARIIKRGRACTEGPITVNEVLAAASVEADENGREWMTVGGTLFIVQVPE